MTGKLTVVDYFTFIGSKLFILSYNVSLQHLTGYAITTPL